MPWLKGRLKLPDPNTSEESNWVKHLFLPKAIHETSAPTRYFFTEKYSKNITAQLTGEAKRNVPNRLSVADHPAPLNQIKDRGGGRGARLV